MRRILFSFLTIGFVFLLALACSEDEPTAPIPAVPAKVLILEDGGTEDSLFKILDSAGFDVTLGGLFQNYTGTNFSAYDLVILLNGFDFSYEMVDSVELGLKNYVTGGGVLLVTEWMCYTIVHFGFNLILDSILPVESDGHSVGGVETYYKESNHDITAGLPDSFVTKATWSISEVFPNSRTQTTDYTVLFSGKSYGGAAMTMGTLGSGRVIHWSMAGQFGGPDIWIPEVRRLFINIAAFSKTI